MYMLRILTSYISVTCLRWRRVYSGYHHWRVIFVYLLFKLGTRKKTNVYSRLLDTAMMFYFLYFYKPHISVEKLMASLATCKLNGPVWNDTESVGKLPGPDNIEDRNDVVTDMTWQVLLPHKLRYRNGFIWDTHVKHTIFISIILPLFYSWIHSDFVKDVRSTFSKY